MDAGGLRSRRQPSSASPPPSDCDSGLEYHIKFPSSQFNYRHENYANGAGGGNNGDEYVFVVNEERVPVVLLFGWAGCQDKYLAKYSRIYEDKGLITLRYIVPVKYLMWKRYHVVRIGRKLVKLLYDLNFDGHPIIIHCFSNGGAFLYQNFSLALEQCQSTDIQVKGVIFDSGPGSRRVISLYRAVSAIAGGNFVYNATVSLLFTLFCSMIWLYETVRKYIFPGDAYLVADPFDRLRNERNMWPQHFIYSETDDLISHKDVELFLTHRKALGVEVTSLKYTCSPHVKHLSENRDTYLASVYDFLSRCLKSPDGALASSSRPL